jgi:hypothetical protein
MLTRCVAPFAFHRHVIIPLVGREGEMLSGMVERDVNASLLAVAAGSIDLVRDPTAAAAHDFPIGAGLGGWPLVCYRLVPLCVLAFVSLHRWGVRFPSLPRLVIMLLLELLVTSVMLLRLVAAYLFGLEPDRFSTRLDGCCF